MLITRIIYKLFTIKIISSLRFILSLLHNNFNKKLNLFTNISIPRIVQFISLQIIILTLNVQTYTKEKILLYSNYL